MWLVMVRRDSARVERVETVEMVRCVNKLSKPLPRRGGDARPLNYGAGCGDKAEYHSNKDQMILTCMTNINITTNQEEIRW